MKTLQRDFQTAIMIITHNLGVVAEMADRVAVMYMGKIVESGNVRTIFHDPLHPYTVGLMQSIPRLGKEAKRRLVPIPGSVPDPFSLPVGCTFYPRCPAPKKDTCRAPEGVALTEAQPGHQVRCTLYQ
jgi:peptide/nickel transport system ATP-binding protein